MLGRFDARRGCVVAIHGWAQGECVPIVPSGLSYPWRSSNPPGECASVLPSCSIELLGHMDAKDEDWISWKED